MSTGKPNERLRYEREIRGWSQKRVADQLDTSEDTVSRWERGERKPDSYYREKLCLLFGKNAEELGLIDPIGSKTEERASESLQVTERLPVVVSDVQRGALTLPAHSRAIDLLCRATDAPPAERSGAWLALGASDLTALFGEGWSVEEVLASLRIVLQGVHAMSKITRRRVLQIGAATVVSGISIPSGRHISAGDRAQLHNALGDSIAAGWKLFHTAGNAQVLAVGQAQLYLVQQAHSLLSSRERNMFYTSVYNLIGKSLHFQERYQEALEAHINAHIAAMATGDPWYVAQSLICQADSRQALGERVQAIETIEEALRILGNPTEEALLRSKAHLLGCWADNAMTIGENITVQKKLEASARYLDQIPPNEEFDRANWFQLAGKYAFTTGDYKTAIEHFEAALAELPPSWIVRQILVLFPMMATYAHQQNQEASFATANKAVSAIRVLNAPGMNRTFGDSVRGLLEAFPNDSRVRTFVTSTLHQLPQ